MNKYEAMFWSIAAICVAATFITGIIYGAAC